MVTEVQDKWTSQSELRVAAWWSVHLHRLHQRMNWQYHTRPMAEYSKGQLTWHRKSNWPAKLLSWQQFVRSLFTAVHGGSLARFGPKGWLGEYRTLASAAQPLYSWARCRCYLAFARASALSTSHVILLGVYKCKFNHTPEQGRVRHSIIRSLNRRAALNQRAKSINTTQRIAFSSHLCDVSAPNAIWLLFVLQSCTACCTIKWQIWLALTASPPDYNSGANWTAGPYNSG